MAVYPFKAAGAPKYGNRKGTLGLAIHMTQGNGGIGDLNYLAGNPARGVSANFYAQNDGTVWRMLGWDEASGSLHPGDISTKTKPYYSGDILKDVLGDKWGNPNAYVISIEIGGKAADGPTNAQRDAVIAWGRDMRERFPTIRGAFGHADQTDQKPCPGRSDNVQAIFEGIGGHGLFKEDTVRKIHRRDGPGGSFVAKPGAFYLDLVTDTLKPADANPRTMATPVTIDPPIKGGAAGADRKTGYAWYGVASAAFILSSDVVFTPDPAPIDCTQAIADDRAKARVNLGTPSIVYEP